MGTVMSARVRSRFLGACALLALAVFCAEASAEVRISEATGDRLTIAAHDATVRQVLDALRAARPVQIRTSDALTRTVTGTYTGSLPRVLSRILDGYDHVIHTTSAGIEIEVFGAAPGVRATASVANSVTLVPNNIPRVSSNLDADEDQGGGTRARTVNAPAPVVPARPVAFTGSVQRPGTPGISSNVDLDEETSR
ncbi:MAG TPA: hypothetical protein VII40_16880 [Xanthobacteraceae bacterium]